jgi:hypothetical protein
LKVLRNHTEERIWAGIVEYANADFGSAAADRVGGFHALYKLCVNWLDPTVGKFSENMPSAFSEEMREMNEGKISPVETLAGYQQPLRQILKWLALSEQPEEEQQDTFAFFVKVVQSIKWEFDRNPKFDPKRPFAAFWIKTPVQFPHILAPICEFLWRQAERYKVGDGDLKEILPIGLCDRPGCGRFRVIKTHRTGHFFCSNLCKASFHQSNKSNKARAEYMRKWRKTSDHLKGKRRR